MALTLITGAGGFVARHLIKELSGEEEIVGLDHKQSVQPPLGIKYMAVDLLEKARVSEVLTRLRPRFIVHLAALSSVAESWTSPAATYRVNVMGTINLLSAATELKPAPRVLVTGSSQEYGKVAQDKMPIREDYPLAPDNPYAASKACQEIAGRQFALGYGLPVIQTRSFNHAGPGQTPAFICSDFAKQIAEIEAGRRPPEIKVGNLQAKRDFTDVRDVARAYVSLLKKGRPGEAYNVCSGRAYAAGEILDKLLDKARLKIKVTVDPEKNRPSDIPLLVGDNSKIKRETGWTPGRDFSQTLSDVLTWWRREVAARRTSSSIGD